MKRQLELQGEARNYTLKAHIERILGHKQFLTVKDFPKIQEWEKNIEKLFKCYKKAISDSIKVQPQIFTNEINEYFERVNKSLEIKCSSEEEMFSEVVALQSELIFLLLGNIGYCKKEKGRNLSECWDLSSYRETQIVQTKSNILNYIEKIVTEKYKGQLDQFAEEKRKENNNENFYLWIFRNKMKGKIE